jgi:hypothetical protein
MCPSRRPPALPTLRPSDLQVRLWCMSVLPELKDRAAWARIRKIGLELEH